MTTTPLVCRDIVVTFPDGPQRRTILDHLHLEVAAGEVVTVSGDSGSGKSTLLAVAGLLRRSDSGDGQRVACVDARARRGAGERFQKGRVIVRNGRDRFGVERPDAH